MLNRTAFWIFLMAAALGLYLLGLGLWLFSSAPWLGAGLFQGILLLHTVELRTALAIGRQRRLSDARIIAKTLAFGFTWWLPLKNGLFKS